MNKLKYSKSCVTCKNSWWNNKHGDMCDVSECVISRDWKKAQQRCVFCIHYPGEQVRASEEKNLLMLFCNAENWCENREGREIDWAQRCPDFEALGSFDILKELTRKTTLKREDVVNTMEFSLNCRTCKHSLNNNSSGKACFTDSGGKLDCSSKDKWEKAQRRCVFCEHYPGLIVKTSIEAALPKLRCFKWSCENRNNTNYNWAQKCEDYKPVRSIKVLPYYPPKKPVETTKKKRHHHFLNCEADCQNFLNCEAISGVIKKHADKFNCCGFKAKKKSIFSKEETAKPVPLSKRDFMGMQGTDPSTYKGCGYVDMHSYLGSAKTKDVFSTEKLGYGTEKSDVMVKSEEPTAKEVYEKMRNDRRDQGAKVRRAMPDDKKTFIKYVKKIDKKWSKVLNIIRYGDETEDFVSLNLLADNMKTLCDNFYKIETKQMSASPFTRCVCGKKIKGAFCSNCGKAT